MPEFKKGDHVKWKNGAHEAVGFVEDVITEETEAGGRKVKASKDEPQYLVRSEKSGRTAVHRAGALSRA
jgi:hypothetical protein